MLLEWKRSRPFCPEAALNLVYLHELGPDRKRPQGVMLRAFDVTVRQQASHHMITDIGKCFFVKRTSTNWNQLPAEALGTFRCKPKTFRNIFRKAIIKGVK